MKPFLPLVLSFVSLAGANAALLVLDDFDSKTAGSLIGQGTAGTVGLTGSYSQGGNATATQFFNVVEGSLAFSTYNSSAGYSILASSVGSGTTTRIQTSLSSAVSGTLYSSYLVNFSSLGDTNGSLAELRVATNAGDAGGSSRFRLLPDVTGATEIHPGAGYDSGAVSTTSSLALNTTYLMIGRFTNVGNELSAGSPGIATVFALTAAQYDSFIAAGGTDAWLDAATVGSSSDQISARTTDTVTSGTYAFVNGNWVQTAVSNSSGTTAQTYTYDAVRFGTTLADVTIPEPSSAWLGAFASLGLLVSRKRR